MSLNFIDIASYQSGIDLSAVFAQNPIHGVIVKATEGLGYVNPYCDRWVQWLRQNGKLWGFYHYLNGSDPRAEAERFVKDTSGYYGEGVPVADYEGRIVSAYGTYYLRRFLETVYELTGVKPLVYCNLSTIQGDRNGFRQIAEAGYGLWLAQYASTDPQYGFRATPWQQGSFAPFERLTMHQYSDHGRLSGYGGNLDLDIFHGTEANWSWYATAHGPATTPAEPAPEPVTEQDWLQDWIDYLQAEIDEKQAKIDELKARQREVR